MTALLGIPESSGIIGKSIRGILHRDSMKALQDFLQHETFRAAQPLELIFLDKNNGEIPVNAWLGRSPLMEAGSFLLQIVDVRNTTRTLDELHKSQKRFHDLFNYSAEGTVILSGGNVETANPAFVAMADLQNPEQLRGVPYENFIGDADKTRILELLAKLSKKRLVSEQSYFSLRRQDGTLLPVSALIQRTEAMGHQETVIRHSDRSQIDGLEHEAAIAKRDSDSLAKFISTTAASNDLPHIALSALSTLLEVLQMESGAVYLFETDSQRYEMCIQKNFPDALRDKIGSPPSEEGVGGYLAKTLETHVYPIGRYPSYLPYRTLFREHGYSTVGYVPVVVAGACSGFVLLISKGLGRTDLPSPLFFTTLSHELGKLLETARTYGRMQDSERALRTMVESVNDVLYRAAPDGAFTYLSRKIAELSGYDYREFFRNKTLWLSLLHRDDKKHLLERSSMLETMGAQVIFEYRILPRGKAVYRWVRDTATIIRDDHGKATGITGVLSDVTNYKGLAEELVQTNELNNSILGSVQEGVVVYNSNLRCIQWNDAMERITGLRKDEVIGKPVSDIIHSGNETIDKLLAQALQGNNVISGESRYVIGKTSREVFLWEQYGPLRDAHGEILGAVGIVSDLTERKSLERELKESEQVLRNVIDTMGDILMITDLKGDILEINRAFLNVLGYSRNEVIGHDFPYPWLIEEEMGRYVLWIGTLREKNWLHDFDMTWKSKDGRLIPMSLSTTLLRNSLGDPIAMVNIARDITERKRLMQDLQNRKNHVELLNRIITAANQSMDFEWIFGRIAEEIRHIAPFDDLMVALLEGGTSFRLIASTGKTREMKGQILAAEETIAFQAVTEGKPIFIADFEDGAHVHMRSKAYGYRSQLTLPIMVEHRTLGAMNLASDLPNAFTEQHLSILQSIASQTGAILDRILLFNKVSEDASYIHNLLDSIDSVVYTIDAQYRILEVNKAWYEFIDDSGGHVFESYGGMSIYDVMVDESIKTLFTTVGKDVLSGVVRFFSQEVVHRTKNGNRIYQVTMNPMIIDRKITGLVISHADITALKDTELALKKNNEQLVALNEISTLFSSTGSIEETLATAVPLLLKTLGADAAVVYLVNRATGRLELALQQGLPPETIAQLETLITRDSATGAVVDTRQPVFIANGAESTQDLPEESRHILISGGIRSVAIIPLTSKESVVGAFDIFYKNGRSFPDPERQLLNLLGSQFGTAIDNAHLYDELRFQIERLTVLYEFSEHLTSKIDPMEIYQVAVDHVARVIPFEEFSIALVRPEQHAIVPAYHVRRAQGEIVPCPDENGVLRLEPGSAELSVLDTKRPYHNPGFTIFHVPMASKESMIGIISVQTSGPKGFSETHFRLLESIGNLTALALEKGKLYEETIQKSLEIEQRNRDLDDFTYVVSHDLKEPLISIEGFSKILQIDYRELLEGEGKDYLDSITGASVRMKALIDDLLMLSRVSHPAESLKQFSVAKVIREIQTDMEYTIRQRDVKFIIPDDLPVVFGIETHMKIVFRNLIGNALKFNRSDHPAVEIGFQNRENISYLFFVRDNGIGIDPEFFDKIFVIFQRLHPREVYEGTGAGLAIVKKIIELHKGRIWVESEPGKGSTFFFTVPQIVHQQ